MIRLNVKKLLALTLVLLAVSLASIVVGVVAINKSDAAFGRANAAKESAFTAIGRLQLLNCHNDRVFRLQYKLRGNAEKQLLNLFLDLARDNIDSGRGGPHQQQINQDFIEQFEPLTKRIKIIDVPKCSAIVRRLDRLGIDVTAKDLKAAPK